MTFSLRFSLFSIPSWDVFYIPDTRAVWPGAKRGRESIKLPVACKGKFFVCICQTDIWGKTEKVRRSLKQSFFLFQGYGIICIPKRAHITACENIYIQGTEEVAPLPPVLQFTVPSQRFGLFQNVTITGNAITLCPLNIKPELYLAYFSMENWNFC